MKGKNKELQAKPTPSQLSLTELASLDHVKNCPRYTSILNRPDGDGVGIEELDSLQMEIEALLVNVMQRNRHLKMETMILDELSGEKNDSIKLSSFSPISRAQTMSATTSNEKTPLTKKMKSFNGKPSATLAKNAALDSVPIVCNDIPDTFWQSVEPYCSEINEDDIKMLENQIELHEQYMSVSKGIQPLGKHYTLQWAEEELGQQVKEGSRFNDLEVSMSTPSKRKAPDADRKYPSVNCLIDESYQKVASKSSSEGESDALTYGPLTQRLISALIEQNLMAPFDNEIADYLDKIGPPPQTIYMSPKTMARKLNFSAASNASSSSLERKIKKALIEQSILDSDENDKANELSGADDDSSSSDFLGIPKEDEIARELRSLQKELKVVSKQCKSTLTQLLETSKKSLIKQEMKKKLSIVDSEIIEIYERCKQMRYVKKPIAKKDKEKAQKLIKDRISLISQLNN